MLCLPIMLNGEGVVACYVLRFFLLHFFGMQQQQQQQPTHRFPQLQKSERKKKYGRKTENAFKELFFDESCHHNFFAIFFKKVSNQRITEKITLNILKELV